MITEGDLVTWYEPDRVHSPDSEQSLGIVVEVSPVRYEKALGKFNVVEPTGALVWWSNSGLYNWIPISYLKQADA
tara:strand:- start:97 stop:321 length:225 start_codon:yes stop_codon:yes gene_type:complete